MLRNCGKGIEATVVHASRSHMSGCLRHDPNLALAQTGMGEEDAGRRKIQLVTDCDQFSFLSASLQTIGSAISLFLTQSQLECEMLFSTAR